MKAGWICPQKTALHFFSRSSAWFTDSSNCSDFSQAHVPHPPVIVRVSHLWDARWTAPKNKNGPCRPYEDCTRASQNDQTFPGHNVNRPQYVSKIFKQWYWQSLSCSTPAIPYNLHHLFDQLHVVTKAYLLYFGCRQSEDKIEKAAGCTIATWTKTNRIMCHAMSTWKTFWSSAIFWHKVLINGSWKQLDNIHSFYSRSLQVLELTAAVSWLCSQHTKITIFPVSHWLHFPSLI